MSSFPNDLYSLSDRPLLHLLRFFTNFAFSFGYHWSCKQMASTEQSSALPLASRMIYRRTTKTVISLKPPSRCLDLVMVHKSTCGNGSRLAAYRGVSQPGLYRFIKDRTFANPAPLGLSAFDLTTFVLSLINLGTRGVSGPNIVVALAFATVVWSSYSLVCGKSTSYPNLYV
jgi:hypothetical protein